MKKNGFTLIEMLVVIAIIGILAAMLSGPLMNARTTALKAACTNNLKGLGTANFQYESPSYFDKAAIGNIATDSFTGNATTLPICALFAAGLLDNIKSVTCPVGSGPAITANSGDGIIASSDSDTGVDPRDNTNYAFTAYYKKGSKSNRVIAGDASNTNYSENHGDTSTNQKGGGGASALFKDNHIKATAPDYSVEGAQTIANDKTNLWANDGANDTGEGTIIGAYSAP